MGEYNLHTPIEFKVDSYTEMLDSLRHSFSLDVFHRFFQIGNCWVMYSPVKIS
jgi:hypothetical protein